MKKATKLLSLLLAVFLCTSIVSACSSRLFLVPSKLADPMGMYFYDGDTKTLLDGSESKPIIEQIEFEYVTHNIDIIDYFYKYDFVYFCAKFNENKNFGLCRYDFSTKSTELIYGREISENDNWINAKILTVTNYFIILYYPRVKEESDTNSTPYATTEYDLYAVDYMGNPLDNPEICDGIAPFSYSAANWIKYSDNFRLIKTEKNGKTSFYIQHLATHEKTFLTTFDFLISDHPSTLWTVESDNLFCFYFYYEREIHNDKYIVIYDKTDGSIHTDLSDKKGFWADTLDLENGIFSFTNQFCIEKSEPNVYQFYKYTHGLGLTLIHTIDNAKYVMLDRLSFFNKKIFYYIETATKKRTITTMYLYNIETTECRETSYDKILKQEGLYSFDQYALENYIFYVTTKQERFLWITRSHYYLHRVDTRTNKNEIVGYNSFRDFSFKRIDY